MPSSACCQYNPVDQPVTLCVFYYSVRSGPVVIADLQMWTMICGQHAKTDISVMKSLLSFLFHKLTSCDIGTMFCSIHCTCKVYM